MPLQSVFIAVKQLLWIEIQAKQFFSFFKKENVAASLSCCSNPISGASFPWEVEKIAFLRKYAVD